MSNINKIFIRPAPKMSPKLRIFFFPFAGGSANAFAPWVKELSDEIEVVIYQPSGRGSRFSEELYQSMDSVVAELLQCSEFITSVPYVLFGHSLGSRIAYELAYQLKVTSGRMPEYFIASGSEPPHLYKMRERIDLLADDEFIDELKSLNGTPESVLANRELMSIFLPGIRADFKIAFEYIGKETKMPFPVCVLYGNRDSNVDAKRCLLWQELSVVKVKYKELHGGHFFINSCRDDVISIINCVIHDVLMNLKNRFTFE